MSRHLVTFSRLRRAGAVLLVLFLLPRPVSADAGPEDTPAAVGETAVSAPEVSAASVVLIDGDGRILYEKEADVRRPMASTTKIMTALVAIEAGDLEREVTVPKEAVGVEGSSVYLTAGEKITFLNLLYALMLESANDAAVAIALLTAGSVETFVERMNRKAETLGLADTHFCNPHGLDEETHYTTARDLAVLTRYALRNETFARIVSTVRTAVPMNGAEGTRLFLNHNRMLIRYEGCLGVKTGYTKKSGRCLVSAAERDGVRLIAVTLQDPDDWRDHARLLDYGFFLLESVVLIGSSGLSACIPVVGGVTDRVRYRLEGPVSAVLPRGDHELSTVFEMRRFCYAPVAEGEVLGRVVWYDGGKEIASRPLIAMSDVEIRPKENGFFRWLRQLFAGKR